MAALMHQRENTQREKNEQWQDGSHDPKARCVRKWTAIHHSNAKGTRVISTCDESLRVIGLAVASDHSLFLLLDALDQRCD